LASYEAILFDFDGVLADSEPVHWRCWLDVIRDYGYSVSWEEFRANCVGVHERGTVEWLRNRRNPPVPFDDLWSEYPRKKQLFRERMLARNAIEEEVVELITRLHHDYLLAVVTSSNQVEVEPILRASGILPLIRTAVYGGDVSNLKPAPDPYLLAAERLGTRNALVIEDSPAGIASGRAAGLDVLEIPVQSAMCRLETEKLSLC
jgi:beta-phosphoglucomutase